MYAVRLNIGTCRALRHNKFMYNMLKRFSPPSFILCYIVVLKHMIFEILFSVHMWLSMSMCCLPWPFNNIPYKSL